jgi:hypothetical protein
MRQALIQYQLTIIKYHIQRSFYEKNIHPFIPFHRIHFECAAYHVYWSK